jgi:hypothetical protein
LGSGVDPATPSPPLLLSSLDYEKVTYCFFKSLGYIMKAAGSKVRR